MRKDTAAGQRAEKVTSFYSPSPGALAIDSAGFAEIITRTTQTTRLGWRPSWGSVLRWGVYFRGVEREKRKGLPECYYLFTLHISFSG